MRVKVSKELSECDDVELLEAFNEAEEDIAFSTGEGLDWFNATARRKAIWAEAKRRGLVGKKKGKVSK